MFRAVRICGWSPSLRGSGLKWIYVVNVIDFRHVSLFTREWIEIDKASDGFTAMKLSPSLRGSGLKYQSVSGTGLKGGVSLFTREWIEISCSLCISTSFWSPSLRGSGLK